VTTKYVADAAALADKGVTGVNFTLGMSAGLLERLADAVVGGRLVPPPVAWIEFDDVPGVLSDASKAPAAGRRSLCSGDVTAISRDVGRSLRALRPAAGHHLGRARQRVHAACSRAWAEPKERAPPPGGKQGRRSAS
jgi:hypothetical protein